MGKYDAYKNVCNLYEKMKEEIWFEEPELYFYLTASHHEILKRNSTREKRLKDDWLLNSFNYYQNEFYEAFLTSKNGLMIDTTEKNKDFSAQIIAEKIKLRR